MVVVSAVEAVANVVAQVVAVSVVEAEEIVELTEQITKNHVAT